MSDIRDYEEIKEEKINRYGKDEALVFTHPAFGMLEFSCITGGDRTLFGSSIKHDDKISLVIKHGEEERYLHSDHYFGLRGKIIGVEMSYSQAVCR